MKSKKLGKSTSRVEVSHISPHGLWLLIKAKEYFLPFSEFPWFRKARVEDIHRVTLLHGHHLYWPSLDIDLDLKSLENLESYPLKQVA